MRIPRWPLTALLLVGLGYLLFFSSVFEIQSILIEGNSQVTKERILESLPNRLNFFQLDSRALAETVRAVDPIIDRVEIYRGFPSSIKIAVVERKGIIAWQSGERVQLIDAQGVVTAQGPTEGSPVLTIVDRRSQPFAVGSVVMTPTSLSFIQQVSELLPTELAVDVDRFELMEHPIDIDAITTSGLRLRFDTRRDPVVLIRALKRISEAYGPQIKESVDLRVEGWAYFK